MRELTDSIDFARQIRCLSLKMVANARASHIASSLSIADILAVLYSHVLNVDCHNPDSIDRDRFILSKGHACVAVYAALAISGFFPASELETYGLDYSIFMSHISHKVPGVEFSTGSLGHGLPFGVGKAIAGKKQGNKWKVFVLLGDGEMDEGSNWEALLFAAHHELDNLVAIIDYNKLQSLTSVSKTLNLEPLSEKIKSFGWSVKETNGHDHKSLRRELTSSPWEIGKPSLLIAHTIKGKGVSFMENKVEWHYKSPDSDQLNMAMNEIEGSDA